MAVAIAVTLTGESITASGQPASTQLVTTTEGFLVSDVLRRGTESSQPSFPDIEASSA